MASSQKPNILLLSVAYEETFDKLHGKLVSALLEASNLKRVKTHKAALDVLQNTPPKAIIITDEGLAKPKPKNQEVLASVKSYIENGGVVIVGLQFPAFIHLDHFDGFFEAFGLSWKRGEYRRYDCKLNRSCVFPTGFRLDSIPDEYSMKAVHVRRAGEGERMYMYTEPEESENDSDTQYPVDELTMEYQLQAAVAAARIGAGTLVYCGDVNDEAGSYTLIMSLCGLNYQSMENRA